MLLRLARLIAPPLCVRCKREGKPLCDDCSELIEPPLPRCTYCKKYNNKLICVVCQRATGIDDLIAIGRYSSVLRELVLTLKFKHQREVSRSLSQLLVPCLSSQDIDPRWTVTNVPTAASRIRQRGFDHTKLLAKYVAHNRQLAYRPLLYRRSSLRQVGATRIQRQLQAGGQFALRSRASLAHVLLVDDVVTTGATLAACASILTGVGAKVTVLVAAQD
jgi:ComF family protein